MSKSGAVGLIKSLKTVMSKRSPEILTGIGIAGMVTTVALAVKATPKAIQLLEEAEKKNIEKQVDAGIPGPEIKNGLPAIEVVKTAWKPYIPAAITGSVSIACLIGSVSVSSRRVAALAAAYQLSETALTEYKDKVIETIGEKKETAVKDKIAKSQVDNNPVNKSEVIVTGGGETLCFEPTSSRYFKSDRDRIQRAVNNLNEQMIHDMFGCVSLNDFYDELGLEHTLVGDDIGWNTDNLIKLYYSSQLVDDKTPCLVINYDTRPIYGYDK